MSETALNPRLAIATAGEITTAERRLERIASFLGGNAVVVPCGDGSSAVLPDGLRRQLAVAISVDTLLALGRHSDPAEVVSALTRENGQVLVFGWRAESFHSQLIHALSGGTINSIEPATSTVASVPLEGRQWTTALAGSEYPATRHAACGFAASPAENCARLLGRGELVTLARVGTARDLFVSTSGLPIDVDSIASEESGLAEAYDDLLPYLIFIRSALGNACWRGSLQTSRLIIDDPPLKRRYGLLNFQQLFDSMEAADYAATLAFIPWNYRRTSLKNAAFFRRQSADSRFSVCVHGCDHTGAEFGSRDEALLRRRAALGMRRMREHQTRTGLTFEPLMVFPQGIFSKAATTALRANGFQAAINTTCFPVDYDRELSIRDLLSPAVNAFGGFPIFGRHYPRSAFDFAFDLYLGRPAFIVEHHEFFGDGLPKLEALIHDLHRRSPGLQSLSAIDAVSRTCWQRSGTAGADIDVQFYTDWFTLTNPETKRLTYSLSKPEPDPDVVERVTLNGSNVRFSAAEGCVSIHAEVEPGEQIDLSIQTRTSPLTTEGFGPSHAARVLMRRGLSEFRDEVLSRDPRLAYAAKRSVSSLRAIAGRGSSA